jgi:hypothetical protein
MTTCSGGVVSLLRSPSGVHTRGRERDGGGRHTKEEEESEWLCCVLLLFLGPSFVQWGGGAPCPSQATKVGSQEEAKGSGQGLVGLGRPAPTYPMNPNPSRLA